PPQRSSYLAGDVCPRAFVSSRAMALGGLVAHGVGHWHRRRCATDPSRGWPRRLIVEPGIHRSHRSRYLRERIRRSVGTLGCLATRAAAIDWRHEPPYYAG